MVITNLLLISELTRQASMPWEMPSLKKEKKQLLNNHISG